MFNKLNKLILIGLCMFLLVGSVNAIWIHQEDANFTWFTGGGWYDEENVIDGNYETYGGDQLIDGESFLYLNYTKIDDSLNSTLWSVKYNTDVATSVHENLSIINDCFSQTPLQLRIEVQGDNPYYSHYDCWDGDTWESIKDVGGTGTTWGIIYEESIWWNTTAPPPDPPTINITSISKTSTLTINKGGMLTISK